MSGYRRQNGGLNSNNRTRKSYDGIILIFDMACRPAEWSSSPAEPPRQALTEPYVSLSTHTALVIQP